MPKSADSTCERDEPLKILTVIQARTGSSRLPGKVLMPLGKKTVLGQMWDRVTASRLAGRVVIATTTETSDDPVVALCEREGMEVFRGHPTDLLERHYHAWQAYGADAVVKIPSDCPLIDPAVIDRVIGFYLEHPGKYDYVSNLHPQSYPDGNDVEVISCAALATAWREAEREFEREHTTPYLWDNPERFRVGNVLWETGQDLSQSHRWTLDYAEDFELITQIFNALWPVDPLFKVESIVKLLKARPELKAINARHLGYIWYQKHTDELKTLGAKELHEPATSS